MSKYIYRIIQKKGEDTYIIQRRKKDWLSWWKFVGMHSMQAGCEMIIRNAIEAERDASITVIKEFR
jgi:hypothetical protein